MVCETPAHPHCLELFEKLSEYIDDELEAAERLAVESHVAGCVACLACLQTLRQTVALCRKGAEHPVPTEFSHRLQTMLVGPPGTGV
jgi:anti-sigma factor RsiW